MARPTTALTVYEIPGRRHGGVRVHRPAEGKASFRVVWVDESGKQRERTFRDRDDAESAAQQQAEALASAVPLAPGAHLAFGDLLDHHLYGKGMSHRWLSEKSVRRPRQIARRIFEEEDLAVPVSALTSDEGAEYLKGVMARVRGLGCKPGGGEYEKAGALIRTVLDVAARDHLIDLPCGNPMTDIRYRMLDFKGSTSDRRAVTVTYVTEDLRPSMVRVDEFVEKTRELFGDDEATYVRVLAYGGLRPGEANGLVPREVLDGEHDGISVDQQILELTAAEAAECEDGQSQQFRLPKWGRIRDAWIPPDLRQELLALVDGRRLGPDDVLFPARNGGLRWQGNWRRDVFTPVATALDWPSQEVQIRNRTERHWVWPVYAFRHAYANYLLKECDVPIYLVSDYMGHRHTWITEHMYAKPQRSDLDFATAAHIRRLNRDEH